MEHQKREVHGRRDTVQENRYKVLNRSTGDGLLGSLRNGEKTGVYLSGFGPAVTATCGVGFAAASNASALYRHNSSFDIERLWQTGKIVQLVLAP